MILIMYIHLSSSSISSNFDSFTFGITAASDAATKQHTIRAITIIIDFIVTVWTTVEEKSQLEKKCEVKITY